MRVRHQEGSVVRDRRRKTWVFRYKDRATGKKRSIYLGSFRELPTKADAMRAASKHKLMINAEVVTETPTLALVVAQYLKKDAPGRYHTLAAYESWLTNHILPEYGDTPIARIKHYDVKDWLRAKDLSDKSKGHIRSLLHRIFGFALERELMPDCTNPIKKVRLAGTTLRKRQPIVLTMEEFWALWAEITWEPFKTMVLLAAATGINCSELCGLKWSDFSFKRQELFVQRSLVANREGEVKTIARSEKIPLDEHLISALVAWREKSEFNSDTDWVWASKFARDPRTKACIPGCLPYFGWGIQRNVILPAGLKLGLGRIGWHTFRHSYRTWLDEMGTPMGVIKGLMRHSDIRTTMNDYGRAQQKPKREANSRLMQVMKKAAGE
jgi:integrase